MKFVVALLLAQVSSIRLRQSQNLAMSYAPVSAEYMQLSADPAPAAAKAAPAQPTAKQAAAAKAAQPVVEEPPKGAESDAKEKTAKHAAIVKENAADLRSNAAIWAGHGAPPPLTAGDIATMAAPRPGFDPSLNPN